MYKKIILIINKVIIKYINSMRKTTKGMKKSRIMMNKNGIYNM